MRTLRGFRRFAGLVFLMAASLLSYEQCYAACHTASPVVTSKSTEAPAKHSCCKSHHQNQKADPPCCKEMTGRLTALETNGATASAPINYCITILPAIGFMTDVLADVPVRASLTNGPPRLTLSHIPTTVLRI